MDFSDYIALISLCIALSTLIYSFLTNTKKYELTYQYFNDVLEWHNQCVEILISLSFNADKTKEKDNLLIKLSSMIEAGRFYFPNIDKKDGLGEKNPVAYKGYRNIVLDFLVYEYDLFKKEDCKKYLKHAELLRRYFTSYVFKYLQPEKHKRRIKKNTNIKDQCDFTLEDFLLKNIENLEYFNDLFSSIHKE